MKINKNLLASARPYDPFSDLPADAPRRCKLASDLAIAIFQYRTENNLTQSALGELLNMKQSQISKLESGDCNLTLERMEEILSKLKYELALHPVTQKSHYTDAFSKNTTWLTIKPPVFVTHSTFVAYA